DQQFGRATILAYDRQVAVVRHYPHLIPPFYHAFVAGAENGMAGLTGRPPSLRDANREYNTVTVGGDVANVGLSLGSGNASST
ncbi:MAG: hypothetical protein WA615_11655, partial [Bradyrhizobium sp.]|uniref:hypothetical protein n=1 Tax=Bradyrhizobium sp. TaxID=376 RepID=UPI003C7B83C0